MASKVRTLGLLSLVLTSLVPYFSSVALAAIGTGGQIILYVETPTGTEKLAYLFKNQDHFNLQTGRVFSFLTSGAFKLKHAVEIVRDPSIAYNLEFTNDTTEVQITPAQQEKGPKATLIVV